MNVTHHPPISLKNDEGESEMIRCERCLMPNTRPGIIFNKEGVCQSCINYDKRKQIDWGKRWNDLVKLCERHKRGDGYYDCILGVSGGKDSHYQAYIIKEELKMNPLLVTVGNPFTMTEAGRHNYRNIGDVFNCDHILFDMSSDMLRRAMRVAFEEYLNPLMFVETACYTYLWNMAVKLGIPLVFFGEDPEYEYGTTAVSKDSANQYIAEGLPVGIFKTIDLKFWEEHGVPKEELNAFVLPTVEEMRKANVNVVFMSYYLPWSSTQHLEVARRFGFRDLAHEWKREGNFEDFEQIDSVAYMVHFWLKYCKFGFARCSDLVSRRIRMGLMTKDEGMELIRKYDHKLDQKSLDDFLQFTGYTNREFWDVVERWWNRDLFQKVDGIWKLKE